MAKLVHQVDVLQDGRWRCPFRACHRYFPKNVQGFEIPCFALFLHHGCGHHHGTRLPKIAHTSTTTRYPQAVSVFPEALRLLDSLGDRFDIHLLPSFRHFDATEERLSLSSSQHALL